MNKPIAELENISAGYQGETVLSDVNLKIYPEDFIGVIGPNGGGKTTMVKVLLGILRPYKGRILFPSGKITIGYLPQASQIDRSFPITVEELVQSGIKSLNPLWPRISKEQKKKCLELINQTGLAEYVKRPIGQLSGGQLQRAFLCRALINEPQLLILDEPNTYVDKNFEDELYKWLKVLNGHMAILLVSHDVGTISSMVKTIACVNHQVHYHHSNEVDEGVLKWYNAPLKVVTHKQPENLIKP